ncbi:MAG TPA: hypothetical protein VL263_13445 [Vicinamibacterales bacterium]|jgi:hypothetical protein|nr:hypothetical protein [Vicinamibacterales bacterium]
MPRVRNRVPNFLTDRRAAITASTPLISPALIEFYREEFLKHHQCLQEQREYFSEQAICGVERALQRVMADLEQLSVKADADQVMARLLREFDVVTGLSAWSDPLKVH